MNVKMYDRTCMMKLNIVRTKEIELEMKTRKEITYIEKSS